MVLIHLNHMVVPIEEAKRQPLLSMILKDSVSPLSCCSAGAAYNSSRAALV